MENRGILEKMTGPNSCSPLNSSIDIVGLEAMRLPSLVAQACDPVLNTKDGALRWYGRWLALTPMGLYNVAATNVFVCPQVPTMARKSVRGSPLSYQSSAAHSH